MRQFKADTSYLWCEKRDQRINIKVCKLIPCWRRNKDKCEALNNFNKKEK